MSQSKTISERLGIHRRWLPESPHAEKIAEWVDAGRCHIVHRGHSAAPLLVFVDGGSMELPTVRWAETGRGWCLVSVAGEHSAEQTTHYDVCGTVDAIKSAVERGEIKLDLRNLLDDIEHMIGRMAKRSDEYSRFFADLQRLLEKDTRRPSAMTAAGHLAQLRNELTPGSSDINVETILKIAEEVRAVAQSLEDSLSDCREIAREAAGYLRTIQGGRSW